MYAVIVVSVELEDEITIAKSHLDIDVAKSVSMIEAGVVRWIETFSIGEPRNV